jgi:alkylated DNA repair dioxygenase AlkB
VQQSLFGARSPEVDREFCRLQRVSLGRGAWIDYVPGWLGGDAIVLELLRQSTSWRAGRRRMYDRMVDVPRLTASIPEDGPGHPVLSEMAMLLSRRYRRPLWRHSLALYRTGRDSVAWHGDRLTNREDALVAVVSLGRPRRFLLRPKGGGPSRSFEAGFGALLVMGGTCQATFEHAVPKVAHAEPRMSIMLREAGTALPSDLARLKREDATLRRSG